MSIDPSTSPPPSPPAPARPAVDLAAITALLHNDLPLTRAMAARLVSWDGRTVTLTAPLAPNLNRGDFAFGGSISSMGILAAYALLTLIFHERQMSMRILIQKSTTEYLHPIDTDLVATACCPEPAALEEFLETIRRKRRARLTLESKVLTDTLPAATHTGLFVAMIY